MTRQRDEKPTAPLPRSSWSGSRSRHPLIHHITNWVVMNDTANATLALGALPVMAHAREEVEEMVGAAGALVLNPGTLFPDLVEAMVLAGKRANERGVPIVYDPVGVGATALPQRDGRAAPEGAAHRRHPGQLGGDRRARGRWRGRQRRGVRGRGGDPQAVARDLASRRAAIVAITGQARHPLRRHARPRSRQRPRDAEDHHRHGLHGNDGGRHLLRRGT